MRALLEAATEGFDYNTFMARRTRPLVSGLQLCIEQLERLNSSDPDVVFALDWAKKAVAWNAELIGAP